MYLFQLCLMRPPWLRHFIYIPLCIYFNRCSIRNLPRVSLFTFHYVSISTRRHKGNPWLLMPFTFHYVSISTYKNLLSLCALSHIYIPLCIYFNLTVFFAFGLFWTLFTFHYVSISTRVNSYDKIIYSEIYIPLCIYFNLFLLYVVDSHDVFTFHYVSISTLPNSKCITIYSNIYIPLCIYFNL